ncbi:MAG: 3-hydroxyacyl-[acyl-carrier-protein] dehydratase FabZ [Acidimicrobiales bacterium]|nr:MAG: beta-hydroxyacyl-ACP dehydratase [Actinomycetota bacterium]MBV6509544.1 3-hydroxyacyl-[acyl-carrier-protein] dehydratase FabZ [Acidimicrobiales bacterium]RIK06592.1 MAG: 3-hydroxyacyl-[acyl-carrier-protein] dehydratase FabZ [Acidobacteriota bacterium]
MTDLQPTDLLDHRPPFLFVDELTEMVPGQSARGLWTPAPDLPFFEGHFPGRPVLPGVILIEAMAQVGACAVLADDSFTGKLPMLGGIDKARFRRQVQPGDLVEMEAEVTKLTKVGGRGRFRATVGGEKAAEADIMFVVVDKAAIEGAG